MIAFFNEERMQHVRLCLLTMFFGWTAPAQHMVHVTPSTVEWGYFAADAKPVLTVKSGEVVTIDTICGIPDMLERLGAAVDGPIREMREMYLKVKERGPGPHFLTGPVAVEGAMPGDV